VTLIFAILFFGVGAGVFIGLLICAHMETGDFMFTDLRRDVLKCLAISGITAAAGVGLFALSANPRVFLALPPVWFIALKICWLDLHFAEIGVIGLSCILSLGVLIALARLVLIS
jgi:hypothetical protein